MGAGGPQSEQRQLMPMGSLFLFLPRLFGKTIFSESHSPGAGGRNGFVTYSLNDRNNWNFGTHGTCIRLKRFERSEAIEPFDRTQGKLLERLELAICMCESRLHGLPSDLRRVVSSWQRLNQVLSIHGRDAG